MQNFGHLIESASNMKFIVLITTLILLSGFIAKAQPRFSFFPDNAQWTVYLETTDCDRPADRYLLNYYVNGDTTINDTSYKKLMLETYGIGGSKVEAVGGLREDGEEVYFTGKTFIGSVQEKEVLLYDFSAVTGDTIRHSGSEYDMHWYSIVLKVDSLEIDGHYRKRMKVNNNWFYQNPDYWVEGIGSTLNGLLGHVSDIPTCGSHYWEHVCYSENGKSVYLNPSYTDCYPDYLINSVKSGPSIQHVWIYPNPVAGELHIHNLTVPGNLKATVINASGKTILEKKLSSVDNRLPALNNTWHIFRNSDRS